jgi:hypothetical protein
VILKDVLPGKVIAISIIILYPVQYTLPRTKILIYPFYILKNSSSFLIQILAVNIHYSKIVCHINYLK